MTAKEAIEILSAYYEVGNDRQNVAMDMAISALEAQDAPYTNVVDMVSRQDAISAICNACGQMDCDKMDSCKKLALPSAQPESHIKSVQSESDKIYGIMKDYYFEHKDEHDQSWQGGFAECMNLIPNVWERREDE